MSVYNLEHLFHPRSLVIVGATDRDGTVGCVVTRNILQGGYAGRIHLVNPNRKTAFSHHTIPSVQAIEETLDLAVVVVHLGAVSDVLIHCAAKGCSGAVIISSGGKETGPTGRALEERVAATASRVGIRILGPNCLGFINNSNQLNTTFNHQSPLPGKVAFISQSGAVCTTIIDLALKKNIGIGYMVSLGNMADVDFGDAIDFLGNKGSVNCIIVYMESLTRIRKFMSAARAVSRVKPIIVLKSGRSPSGAKAASSHTGSMAGEDAIYSSAFKRTGIVRVWTFEELFDCAELLAKQPRPPTPDLAVVTNAGGMGVIAMDSLNDHGVDPVRLEQATIAELDEELPANWSRSNPVDIRGDATPEQYRKAAEILLQANEVKGLLFIHVPQAISAPVEVARALVEVLAHRSFPVITSWMGGEESERAREVFHRANIPTFDSVERAVRAFMDLYSYARNLEALQEVPPKLSGSLEIDRDAAQRIIDLGCSASPPRLTETESKRLLAAYGIPVNRTELATERGEAAQMARKVGFPVVMKIASRDILHKTDANGVRLNVRNETEALQAFDSIMDQARGYAQQAALDGVSVQPMARHIDCELILGSKKDEDFGPIILFGMGGILTEVLGDRSIGLPPLNRLLARRLIQETKVYRLLRGYRNLPSVNLVQLEEVLIRLASLVADFSEIRELDINPLIAAEGEVIALDARVVLDPEPSAKAPFHMVISSYPNQYETYHCLASGKKVFIRPIKPEDAPLLLELFDNLSAESIYLRFFSPLKQLPRYLLVRFTQIDYDREIALVALWQERDKETMLGVARIMSEYGGEVGEFSILVMDAWHGKGIGAALLSNCLGIAKSRGYKSIWGIVLPQNTNMLALGRKLGFQVKRSSESGDYILNFDLTKWSGTGKSGALSVNQ